MPQISPLMWPLIYLALIHFLAVVNVTLQNTFPYLSSINNETVTSQQNPWNW